MIDYLLALQLRTKIPARRLTALRQH